MLGFLAWEYLGTDIVAEHRQADIRADLRASWQYPTVPDVLGPQAADVTLGAADALIRIPRFGSGYEVPVIEGVRDSDLDHGIGHFPGTGPGQIGNFALAGYREVYAGPFDDMASLRPGDRVIVETADAVYTYRLDTDPNDLVVPLSQSWVTNPVPIPPKGAGTAGDAGVGLDRPDPGPHHACDVLGAVPPRQPNGHLRPSRLRDAEVGSGSAAARVRP